VWRNNQHTQVKTGKEQGNGNGEIAPDYSTLMADNL
jgi:hypothetical protein